MKAFLAGLVKKTGFWIAVALAFAGAWLTSAMKSRRVDKLETQEDAVEEQDGAVRDEASKAHDEVRVVIGESPTPYHGRADVEKLTADQVRAELAKRGIQ